MWQGSAERSEAGVEVEFPPERDSPAAQAGSEPQVSHEIDATIHSHPDGPPALLVGEEMATPLRGGTTSSNPSCSSGESGANLIFGDESHRWSSKASIHRAGDGAPEQA